MNELPVIGSVGKYKFNAPFDGYNKLDTEFSCQALYKLSEFSAAGNNPEKDIYAKHMLSSEYPQALEDDITIVTLKGTTGTVLYVPFNYIEVAPVSVGVSYAGAVLGVNVGILPTSQDLTATEDAIKAVVLETIGVDCTIDKVTVTNTSVLDIAKHEMIQTTRANKRDNNPSDKSKLLVAKNDYDLLLLKLKNLEKYIEDNYI